MTKTYLLVLRCGIDDLPLMVTDDETVARHTASDPVELRRLFDHTLNVLGIDVTVIFRLDLWTYDGTGVLVEAETVVEYEDSDENDADEVYGPFEG